MSTRHPSIKPAHPGEILREDTIPACGRTKVQVAKDLGISRQMLYDILNEEKPVSAVMALRLSAYFGTTPQFWLNLQTAYDLAIAEEDFDTSSITALSA